MGRTFGFLIVSIGLWLIFSLPTREAGLEPPDNLSASRPLPAGNGAEQQKPISGTPVGGKTASLPDPHAVPVRQTTGQSSVRTNRAHEERTQAARSREIEAEPDAAMQHPPEPVAITAAARPVDLPSAPTKVVTTKDVTTLVVTTQAHVAASGATRLALPNVQAIPAPVPVAPMLARAAVPLRLAQAVEPAKPARSAAAPEAPATTAGRTAMIAPASPAARPSELAAAAIKAPRIFDTVRRDLAASSASTKTERAGADWVATVAAKDSRPTDVAAQAKVIVPTSKVPVDRRSVEVTAAEPAKPARLTIRVRAAETSDVASAKPELVKKPQRVAEAVRPENRPRQQFAATPTPPPAPRLRYAQAYAPPSYVGRVTYRYTPPAVFVPSSGSTRRAKFRSDTMWESIRRSGM